MQGYFFPLGGKWLNIFSTLLSSSLMFLSELLERVSLADPRQISFLLFRVEDIDDHSPDLIRFDGRRCITKTSEPAPAPAATESVVERVQRLLVVGCLDGYDGSIATGLRFRPPFRCERGLTAALKRSIMRGSRVLTFCQE